MQNFDKAICFEKASKGTQAVIFTWLAEPHMQEFWDNSQEHKDDIITFINGRVSPSNYFDGIFTYWIGKLDHDPFCLILTAQVLEKESHPKVWQQHISKTGTTYSLDFGIGNKMYLGKKLAAPTLERFMVFFQNKIDPSADTFFIDPSEQNPRAKHVYEKAGFKIAGDFIMSTGVFEGEQSHLMVKKLAIEF